MVLLQVLAAFLLVVAGAAFLSGESDTVRYAIAGTLAAHVILLELSFFGIMKGWRWAYGLGCLTCFPGAILTLARAGEVSLLALREGAVEYYRTATLFTVSCLLMAAPIPAMVAAYLRLPKKSLPPLRVPGTHGRLAQRPLKQAPPDGPPHSS